MNRFNVVKQAHDYDPQGDYLGVFAMPKSYAGRFIFEKFWLQKIIKKNHIESIFTFFGAGLPHPLNVRSVVTVAYPIICYPDSPYWRHVPWFAGIKKRFINYLRRARLKQASRIIVETEVMKARLSRALSFPIGNISVVPPVPSSYVTTVQYDYHFKGKSYLFISGNDPHKNLWRLYGVAEKLEEAGWDDFIFMLTIKESQYVASMKEKQIDRRLLDKHFRFLGQVDPEKILDVYGRADFVVLLSDLESFSNNYMEAWKAGIPLIASDRDFSRSICGDSAIYVEPHDVADVAKKMLEVADDSEMKRQLVQAGRKCLETLPDMEQRWAIIWPLILGYPETGQTG